MVITHRAICIATLKLYSAFARLTTFIAKTKELSFVGMICDSIGRPTHLSIPLVLQCYQGINLLACELPLSRERERAYTLTVYA